MTKVFRVQDAVDAGFPGAQAIIRTYREVWKTRKTGKKDKYGRILGTVWVDVPAPDGKGAVRCDANRSMLYAGLAWHYKRFDSSKAYSDAESDARRARLGLWRDPNPVPPEEFRKSGSAATRKRGPESSRGAEP